MSKKKSLFKFNQPIGSVTSVELQKLFSNLGLVV